MKLQLFGYELNLARRSLENPNTSLKDGADWLFDSLGGHSSASGIRVNEQTAMRSSAVWGCIRVISSALAGLPLVVYRRTEKGREVARDHHLYRLLHDTPNKSMSSFTWRQVKQVHLMASGNAISYIRRGGKNLRPLEFVPLTPEKVLPERKNGELVYRVTLEDGRTEDVEAWRVLHVPGMGFDGITGYSPIRMAADNVGLSLAAQEFGARFFGQGASPSGVLEHPSTLSDQAREYLKNSFSAAYSGVGNSHKTVVLEEGMKLNPTTIPPEEAQFLETRKFQVEDIARIYGVPLHMLSSTEKSTSWGTGLEQQNLGFVVHTLRPWLVSWEQELNRKLLLPSEQDEYYIEFKLDALLRGDTKSRYEAYAIGRQWGWLAVNDIREMENMDAIDNGDTYLVPLNMGPHDAKPEETELNNLRLHVVSQLIKREKNGLQKQLKKDRSEFTEWWTEFNQLSVSQLTETLEIPQQQALRFIDDGFRTLESLDYELPQDWESMRVKALMELINE